MKLLIVAATSYEIATLLTYLDQNTKKVSFFEYDYNGHTIYPFVTGVGIFQTAFNLARFNNYKDLDYAINLGVGGAFSDNYKLGQVVEIVRDRFADLGVEEADGSFTDVHELNLIDGGKFPYQNGWIENKNTTEKLTFDIEKVSGITVNTVHGTQKSIDAISKKYNPDVETMEGAAFFNVCKALDVDCAQIRSISNKVEPRNRDNWEIALAIDNLNDYMIKYLNQLPLSTESP